MSKLPLIVLLSSLSFGCAVERGLEGEDPASSSADAVEGVARITFDGAYNETVTGTFRAGGKVEIVYEPSRLTTCRGTEGGRPQWGIDGQWRIDGGTVSGFTIAGLMAPSGNKVTVELPRSGDLELWFVNTSKYGCIAYDSEYGRNYHFKVLPSVNAPGWIGNANYAISRLTCEGSACDSTLKSLESGFKYDSWARQRAFVTHAYFEVWKEGVTDFDNPDLWKQLDVQVRYRSVGAAAWKSAYVPFEKRVGNNARYATWLRQIDPLGGHTRTTKAECPEGTLTITPDGYSVQTEVELYFVVNGVELRPASGGTYRGVFEDYRDLYKPCL